MVKASPPINAQFALAKDNDGDCTRVAEIVAGQLVPLLKFGSEGEAREAIKRFRKTFGRQR